jgi:5-methylcytosine-specific restriction protein A
MVARPSARCADEQPARIRYASDGERRRPRMNWRRRNKTEAILDGYAAGRTPESEMRASAAWLLPFNLARPHLSFIGDRMPYAAPRHCPHHHRLFTGSRCPDCEREGKARADARRPNSGERGYDAEWRKARADFLDAHPTCSHCDAPATVVDHVVAHKGDKTLFWDRSNWQPLCKRCHDHKTATQDGAFKPRPGGVGSRSW